MEYKVGDWLFGKANTRNKVELCRFKEMYSTSYKCEFFDEYGNVSNLLNIDPPNFNTVRRALPHEIPGYISSSKPESYKYLTKLFKKLKIK